MTEVRAYNAAEYRERELERWNAIPVTIRCMFCPEWSHTGPTLEAREEARQHRREAHPNLRPKRYRRKGNPSFVRQPDMSKEERQEIAAEVKRRAFLNGVEI